jgi:formylglycine-generating enzyme required for sulfatase activity
MGSRLAVAQSVPAVVTKEVSSPAISSTVSGPSTQAEKKKKTSTFIVVAITAAIAAFASIFYLTVLRQSGSGEAGINRIVVPPKMKLINGGAFKLGTDDIRRSPEGRDGNLGWRPAHDVTVNTFFLDLYEVSNEDYQRFVRQKGYQPPPHWTGEEFPKGEAKLPVYNVTWNDANAYCEWTGKRLPTEAEWEFAARGTAGLLYPWGNEWSPERANSGEDRKGVPVAIGSFPAGVSPFGIFDMAGNVAEWVQDDYKPYPGSSAAPITGQKVFRGGSYLTAKDDLILPARFSEFPIYSDKYLGFRCAQGATTGK